MSRAVILTRLSIPQSTFKYWQRRGYVKPVARLPSCYVYSWKAIDAWLQATGRGDLLRPSLRPRCKRCGHEMQVQAAMCGLCLLDKDEIMAEQLEEFDFSVSRGGRAPKYPWDQWLNGRPWRCIQGQDFDCLPHTFMGLARKAARREDLEVKIKRVGQAVVIQAYTPNGASSA